MTKLHARFLILVISEGHGGTGDVELPLLTWLRKGAIGLHDSRTDTGNEYPGTSGGANPSGGRPQRNYRTGLCHTVCLANLGIRKYFHHLLLKLGGDRCSATSQEADV